MFKLACGPKERGGWGMNPSEFWMMSPGEWWDLWDFTIGEDYKEENDTRERLKNLLAIARQREQAAP